MDTKKHAKNTNENPCNMCMPMGGILALKGIEQTMVVLHGSQGCSTYMRRHIAEHFNEPVDVGSSALNEKGTVYGGENNLKLALDNIRRVYRPKLIGILTTCLAETIGEDVERIAGDYIRENGLDPLSIVTSPTPGYGGSHFTGYIATLRRIVAHLAGSSQERHNRINVIVPNISTADIREIKRIIALFDLEAVICPDISDTLDRPYAKDYTKMPAAGTPVAHIRAMGQAPATIEFGLTIDDDLSPGKCLADAYGVPLYRLPLPVGVQNSDLFINTLKELSGRPTPVNLVNERGRLLDAMIDSHKYNHAGRSVIFGDPEFVHSVAGLCIENGVYPVVVATGSKNAKLSELVNRLAVDMPFKAEVLDETDFQCIRDSALKHGANIAIGHSDGKYLEEKAGIPLVRAGFPVHDRVGGQRILSVGYAGTSNLLDRITNTLLEHKHKKYRSSMYQLYYQGYSEGGGDFSEL